MTKCKCGRKIPSYVVIDGRRRRVRGRRRCFRCLPFGVRKERICAKCEEPFPPSAIIDGRRVSLKVRRYCLDCSPFNDRSHIRLWNKTKPKTCRLCGKLRDRDDFPITVKEQGLRSSYCQDCLRTYQRRKHQIFKNKCVEYLGGKCHYCGYHKCLSALAFHHRKPGEKEFSISQVRHTNFSRVKKELDKCDLACFNCHEEIHEKWREKELGRRLDTTRGSGWRDR